MKLIVSASLILLFHLLVQGHSTSQISSSSCSLISPHLSDHAAPRPSLSTQTDDDEWIRLIVRFKGPHLMSQDHHAKLHSLLPNQDRAWRWIERHNAASSHPTDFAILSVPSRPDSDASLILDESRRILSMTELLGDYIRDVHIDRRFVGKLKWIPDEANSDDDLGALRDAVMTDSDLGSFFAQGSDDDQDLTVTKRAGRITTRFSFEPETEPNSTSFEEEEEEEEEVDRSRRHLSSTIGRRFISPDDHEPSPHSSSSSHPHHHHHHRQRRLKGARLPLTTAMGADKLWAKGFTGKGGPKLEASRQPMSQMHTDPPPFPPSQAKESRWAPLTLASAQSTRTYATSRRGPTGRTRPLLTTA